MAKGPFKNLSSPASNTNAPTKETIKPVEPGPIEDASRNGERPNTLRDGPEPLAWPAPDNKHPMKLKGE